MNQPAKQEQDTRIPYPTDTVFLVPDVPYDAQVIRGYLNKKYKNLPKDMVVSQLNMTAFPHIDIKIVVCVRRGRDGGVPGPDHEPPFRDQFGRAVSKPIPPETYHDEVRESPAVRLRDYIQVPKFTLFTATEPNLNPLIDVLAEHAIPYRIFPQNKPDVLLRLQAAI